MRKVKVYDYTTRDEDNIPHKPNAMSVTLEVIKDTYGVQNVLATLTLDEQIKSAVVCAGNSGLPGGSWTRHQCERTYQKTG